MFNPTSPLHDGAVIIQNDIIEAAACILPLTESTSITPDMGTRHRAALGLSEETDAIIIVVSEETKKYLLQRMVDLSILRRMKWLYAGTLTSSYLFHQVTNKF